MKQFDSENDPNSPLKTNWEQEMRSRLKDDKRSVPECAWENISDQINTSNNKYSYWQGSRTQWIKGVAAVLLIIMLSVGGGVFFNLNNPLNAPKLQTGNHISSELKNGIQTPQNQSNINNEKYINSNDVASTGFLPFQNFLEEQRVNVQDIAITDNNSFDYVYVNELNHNELKPLNSLAIPMFTYNEALLKTSGNIKQFLVVPFDDHPIEPINAKLHWIENENQPRKKRWAFGTTLGTGTYRDDINTTRDVSFTSMKETLDGEMISFKRMRDTVSIQEQTNLSPIWSYQAGFLVSYALNKRFSLQSGAQYTLQKTSRTGEYILRNVEHGHTLAPTTIPINDTTVYELERYDLEMPQTLHYVGLPVRLTLKIGGNKWNVTTSGGLLLNYLVDAPIPSSRQIKKKGVPTIFNPWHLSCLVGIGIQYQLNNQYAVALEPNLRFSITSMTRDQVESSYPHSVGVALSIVRNL